MVVGVAFGQDGVVRPAIRRFQAGDARDVVEFSLRAWTPVFESMAQALGSRVFKRLYPDWLAIQARTVSSACETMEVWVADLNGSPVGFVAAELRHELSEGQIDMLAVDPDHQRQGIGAALISVAVDWIKEAGMTLAVVGTGGDPGHEPARLAYENAGFKPMPLVRYYLMVQDKSIAVALPR